MSRMSRFTQYAWGVLTFNFAVIIWGAYVRASLSGAGCGSHWPLCNGQFIPQAETIKTWVEFGHRVSSGLSLVSITLLFVWAFRKFPKGSAVRKSAAWAMGFILSEALIGAALVLFGWVAENKSLARVFSISLHLVNTLFLIASLTLTARWSSNKSGKKSGRLFSESALANRWAVCLALGWILVGVTGAITALGDTLFPALSLGQGFQQDISVGSHFLQKLRVLHPLFAIGLGTLVFVVAANWRDRTRIASAAMLLIVCQWTLGLINLWFLAPITIQLAHLGVATLLWIVLISLWDERENVGFELDMRKA